MRQKDKMQNPWAGLSSYEDPVKSIRKLKFCGRDRETFDLTRLIDDNFFVTLYGKSGIGKTSLLNAGVFPALRLKQYTPLNLRLGMIDETQTFQDTITSAVEHAIEEAGGSVRVRSVVDEQADRTAVDYLWNWFARRQFVTKDKQTTFPVVVLDQFEETFRLADLRVKTEMLLAQLHYLIDESHALNDCIVDGEEYTYDFNFRFVLSIREDDLYRLEDSLDNCSLSTLKRCRYRLRSLSEQGARAAIMVPGEGLFRPDDQDQIVRTIIGISCNKEDQDISTNLLSLVCNRIFVDFQNETDTDYISLSLVDSFLKDNPFERFYNEATAGFSNREKSYIEDHLVDSSGRRNSIPESDFLLNVPHGQQLLENNTRILQRVSTSSDGGNYRYELIHDSFCEPLSTQKEKRDKRKRMRWLVSVTGVALLSFAIIAFVLYQMKLVTEANKNMLITRSRYIAEKASNLVDEGDSYTARLLCVNILPEDFDKTNEPYFFEVEIALRKAMLNNNAILSGHSSTVWHVAYSSDGKRLISASNDNTVRLWDTQNGKCLNVMQGHEGRVNTASFSPNGNYAVSSSSDTTVRIWDLKSGKEVLILKGHSDRVNSAVYSPNGNLIVSASYDTTIRIWDAHSGKLKNVLLGHTAEVNYANFSPDGKYIVSASKDNTIRIWEIKTNKCLKILKGHTKLIDYAAFSPDGKQIVSASNDMTIRIWDVLSGKTIQILKGHSALVRSANFSPDGKYVISASDDKTVRIWDVKTGVIIFEKEHPASVKFAVFSPDMQSIAYSSLRNDIMIRELDLNNDKKTIACNAGAIFSIAYNSDGDKLAMASSRGIIQIWDVQSKKILKEWNGDTCGIHSLMFSPDGQQLVSSSESGIIRIWDSKTGEKFRILRGHRFGVNSVSYSPDGKLIASASFDTTIRIWDPTSEKCLHVLKGHKNGVHSVSFSHDGSKLVSASGDGTIRIWDVLTGKELRVLNNIFCPINYAAFCPDGRIVFTSSDQTIRIWDINSSKNVILDGAVDYFGAFSISHKGNLLASASEEKTICVWNLETGKVVEMIAGHNAAIYSVAFSPDGQSIASASADGIIHFWDFLPLQKIIKETRDRFTTRELTQEERLKYYLN